MENKTKGLMIAIIALAVLLVGSVVAIVFLAVNRSDEGDTQALERQVQELEDQIEDLEDEISSLESELDSEKDDEGKDDSDGTSQLSDEDILRAVGEEIAGDEYDVGEIVIDGDWARVSIAPKDPLTQQGENFYLYKFGGEWNVVDYGTGLGYGDIPGAPESIFP